MIHVNINVCDLHIRLIHLNFCMQDLSIRCYQNILHIFHNSHNKYGSFKWRQTSRLQWPPYKLCSTVLSTQCLCGLCKNNRLSIISKKLALWQTNYSSGFHPLAQEEADYTFIFVVCWPQLAPGTHQSHSITPLCGWTGRDNVTQGSWFERRGGDHSPITILNKTDSTYRKINSLTIKLE